jgi:hypothetical protein
MDTHADVFAPVFYGVLDPVTGTFAKQDEHNTAGDNRGYDPGAEGCSVANPICNLRRRVYTYRNKIFSNSFSLSTPFIS